MGRRRPVASIASDSVSTAPAGPYRTFGYNLWLVSLPVSKLRINMQADDVGARRSHFIRLLS